MRKVCDCLCRTVDGEWLQIGKRKIRDLGSRVWREEWVTDFVGLGRGSNSKANRRAAFAWELRRCAVWAASGLGGAEIRRPRLV